MRAELLRVFPAERERVGRIHAARDHAHERFVVLRLRPRHFFKLQDFRRAILICDDRCHHRLFVGARGITQGNYEDRHA